MVCIILIIILGCIGCQQLQEELVSSKADMLRLRSALNFQKETITLVQHQIREMEVKYSRELNLKDEILKKLNADLETKSNTVALITQRYHQLSLRFHCEQTSSGTQTSTICTCQKHNDHKVTSVSEQRATSSDRDMINSRDSQTSQLQYRGTQFEPKPPSGISRRSYTVNQPINAHDTSPSVPWEVSSMSSLEISAPIASSPAYYKVPTPPKSSRPLSSSSSPPHLRRASKPIRRQTSSLGAVVPVRGITQTSSHVTSGLLPSKHQMKARRIHENFPNSSDRLSTSTLFDPGTVQKHKVLTSDMSDILPSYEKDVQLLSHTSPPLLPPIVTDGGIDTSTIGNSSANPTLDQLDLIPLINSTNSLTNHNLQTIPPSRARLPHHNFILSRSRVHGMNSAPVRAMRVMYHGQNGLDQQNDADMKDDSKISLDDAAGRVLLVEDVTGSREDQKWQQLYQRGTD